ncbi:nuclear transport factor 2 family protein [Alteraurantiacibacter aquimixticola]|uniref:nuclear transport factor 2 family protein n=1 Tax=Alteraurantiacibacter aquimixticola TaxID=2489173 RepID=UPI00145C0452|nr:nuclear transport factor 2 family protein [Alteraurantiacibacter aquimixticola]
MTRRLALTLAACALAATPVHAQQQSPAEAVVQAHIDAYRAGDFEAFLATFARDAVLSYDGMMFYGRTEIREAYHLNFQPGAPSFYLVSSGTKGNLVWLRAGYTLADGTDICCSDTAYAVQDGHIVRADVAGP